MDGAAESIEAILQRLHADVVVVTSTAVIGVINGRPTIGVDDRVGRVDSSLSSSLSPRKEMVDLQTPLASPTTSLE